MEQLCAGTELNNYAREFLKKIHAQTRCRWCKHPEQAIHSGGFCRHCYRIRRQLAALSSRIEECKSRKQPISRDLDSRFKVAAKMVELAKMEGSTYGDLHRKKVMGVDLEHQLSLLSKSLLGKDVYFGDANLLDWSFSPVQKRLIYYLLSKLLRERARKTRRGTATSLVHIGELHEETAKFSKR